MQRLAGQCRVLLCTDGRAQRSGGLASARIHADRDRSRRLACGIDGHDRLTEHAERDRLDRVLRKRGGHRHLTHDLFGSCDDIGSIQLHSPCSPAR